MPVLQAYWRYAFKVLAGGFYLLTGILAAQTRLRDLLIMALPIASSPEFTVSTSSHPTIYAASARICPASTLSSPSTIKTFTKQASSVRSPIPSISRPFLAEVECKVMHLKQGVKQNSKYKKRRQPDGSETDVW